MTAADTLSRFVEGDNAGGARGRGRTGAGAGVREDKRDFWDSFGEAPAGPPEEKRGFWDDFGAAGEERMAAKERLLDGGASANVGTAAMRNTGKGKAPATAVVRQEEEWKEEW